MFELVRWTSENSGLEKKRVFRDFVCFHLLFLYATNGTTDTHLFSPFPVDWDIPNEVDSNWISSMTYIDFPGIVHSDVHSDLAPSNVTMHNRALSDLLRIISFCPQLKQTSSQTAIVFSKSAVARRLPTHSSAKPTSPTGYSKAPTSRH